MSPENAVQEHIYVLWLDPVIITDSLFQILSDPPTDAVTSTPIVNAIVNGTARFNCTVNIRGNPDTYTFVWSICEGDNIVENSGVWEFFVYSVEEEGTYCCTPKNIAGEGTPAEIELIVNSK